MAPRVDNEADWRLECGDMKTRGEHILQSGLFSDCTFLVGLGPRKVEIKAHKLLLAMASPVFEAMFYGPLAERSDPITIPDISPDTFRILLQYVYTDNIKLCFPSFTIARDVYYAAQKYMLTHLMKKCTLYLSSNLDYSPGKAGQTYEFNAKFICDKELEEKSLKMMATDTKKILDECSFEELEIETVLTLFKMDTLNIDSELDLFAAAERYALARGIRSEDKASEDSGPEDIKGLLPEDDTNNKKAPDGLARQVSASLNISNEPRGGNETAQVNDNKNRPTIRDLLCQIRFLTLTAEQFAEYETLTSLLSEAEIMFLLMNIVSSKTHAPMPRGFSTCTEQRKKMKYDEPERLETLQPPAFGRPAFSFALRPL